MAHSRAAAAHLSWRGRAAVVSDRHCGVLLTLLWQCAQSYVLKSARPDGAYAPFLKRILRAERSGFLTRDWYPYVEPI